MYLEIVKTIAEVAGGLIGFVGVVFVLGGRAKRSLTQRERSGMLHLLIAAIGTLIISILTMIFVAAVEETTAWKLSALICATYAIAGPIKAIREEISSNHILPAPFNWGLPIISVVIGITGLLTVVEIFPGYAQLTSVSTMLLGLIVAITYFVSLLTGFNEKDDSAGA